MDEIDQGLKEKQREREVWKFNAYVQPGGPTTVQRNSKLVSPVAPATGPTPDGNPKGDDFALDLLLLNRQAVFASICT